MKKKWIFSGLLALCLCLALLPCAYADEYITLGSFTAGSDLECPIASVPEGAELTAENLPDGLQVEVRTNEVGSALYLVGRPMTAGSFTFTISGTETLVCTIDISAATPSVGVSDPVSCWVGDSAALSVFASTPDAGTLSYQWYLENGLDTQPLPGETGSTLQPDTSVPGSWNYVCEVTNNNNGDLRVSLSDLITLTVREVQVSSVSIETMPNKLDYAVGESFDHTGMTLRVTYDNGTQEVISSGYEIEVDPFDLAGTHTVKVSYGGRGWSFYVNVQKKEAVVSGIGVLTLPNKREYLLGENLQTAGLSIRVYTDDGEHYDVSTDLDCSPTVMSTEGEQIITVRYQEKTCTFKVTVKNDKVVTGISVLTLPATRSYTVGDYLDTSGLSVQLNSNKGAEVLTGGYTVSPKVLATPGTQEVTVRYEKYTAKFTVTVKAKEAITPTPRPTPTPTPTPSQSPLPGAVSSSPGPDVSASPDPNASARPVPTPTRRNTGVSAVVKIFFAVAVLALAGLAGYIWYLRKQGFDGEDYAPAESTAEAPAVYGEPVEPEQPAEPRVPPIHTVWRPEEAAPPAAPVTPVQPAQHAQTEPPAQHAQTETPTHPAEPSWHAESIEPLDPIEPLEPIQPQTPPEGHKPE